MAAFTNVPDGFLPQMSSQFATYMTEIITATNERRLAALAVGATGLPSAISETTSAHNFQGSASVDPTHLLIQEMLEAVAIWFVDYTQVGYTDASTSHPIAQFTVETWCTAASLNASGFRRATVWADSSVAPSFSYGKIQTGDIAGYWIWQDIVAGLKALKWCIKQANEVIAWQYREAEVYNNATVAAAISATDAVWAAASWADREITAFALAYVRSTGGIITPCGGIDPYCGMIYADKQKMRVNLSTTVTFAFSAVFLIRPNVHDNDVYYDLEGLTEDVWIAKETVNSAADVALADMSVWNIIAPSSTPLDDSGVSVFGESHGSITFASNYVVLKWNFTYE